MSKLCVSMSSACIFVMIIMTSYSLAIIRAMSTEDLTMESDIVVQGEVKNVKAHWSRDGKSIFTRVMIMKQNMIKGVSGKRTVIVEYEGGEIDDIGLRVSDISPLKEGERVILFLRVGQSNNDGEAFHIVGKGQGKYVIDDKGIARKQGFSVMEGDDLIDNNIPVEELIDKIKRHSY